jgi:hypothetical protein
MAKLLEKPVQEVYEISKEAGAIKTLPNDSKIYIDIEIYQNYLDTEIIDILKYVNSKENNNDSNIEKVEV